MREGTVISLLPLCKSISVVCVETSGAGHVHALNYSWFPTLQAHRLHLQGLPISGDLPQGNQPLDTQDDIGVWYVNYKKVIHQGVGPHSD